MENKRRYEMSRRDQLLLWTVVVSLVTWGAAQLDAAEHPGKEHPGVTKEHAGTAKGQAGGTTPSAVATPAVATLPSAPPMTQEKMSKPAEPSNEEIRMAMQAYALKVASEHSGFFPIHDDKAVKDRKLTFQRIHQRVGKLSTRDGYFSCADFVDEESGETLDIDFWVTLKDGKLEVTGSEIHKVNGQARFTYNEKDEKIML